MNILHPVPQIISDIKVEYPQGAGGMFISTVLFCCVRDVDWVDTKRVNFHNSPCRVDSNHFFPENENTISIDSPRSRYNFWIYYFRKRLMRDEIIYRHHGRRWIKCPFQSLDIAGDGYWVLDQCRYINTYQSRQKWNIDWIQMIQDPDPAWETIQSFLESNKKQNFWKKSQWYQALSNYKETLPKKVVINPNHVSWQIWATAVLQDKGIAPAFHIPTHFGDKIYLEWLSAYIPDILEYTKEKTWDID